MGLSALEAFEHLQPARPGHADVRDDQVVLLIPELQEICPQVKQKIVTAAARSDLMPAVAQGRGKQRPEFIIVLGYQDSERRSRLRGR